MNYVLTTMQGDKFKITKAEYENMNNSNSVLVFLKSSGVTINKATISSIYPENSENLLQDKSKQKVGILHDGQKARKHFGQWVSYREVPDESGNYSPVRFDINYYPEIAIDCVATPGQYKEITLKKIDYYEFLGIENKIKRINKGFEKLSVKK